MSEAKIQAAIITNLEKAGWYVIKLIQTNKNGVPDLLAIKGGKSVFIEVKAPGRKPTAMQLYRHLQLSCAGVMIHVTSDKNFCL